MTSTITHPLILPGKVQAREYQTTIAAASKDRNTLVVLPTGAGKTPVALLVIAEKLSTGKAVMVAPTKPLSEQHCSYFSRMLPTTKVCLLTGELAASKRQKLWQENQLIIATPQSIENDLKNQVYTLEDVSLLVIDEAHRAVGAYAYTKVAQAYQETNPEGQILAMTASPGGKEEQIDAIKQALGIEHVEVRTEDSPDVKEYLHDKETEIISLQLPPILQEASDTLKDSLSSRYTALKDAGFKCSNQPSMKDLNRLKIEASKLISEKNGAGYQLAMIHAEILKLRHALLIAESQGLLPLKKYLSKLQKEESKSSARIVQELGFLIHSLNEEEEEVHPKVKVLPNIVRSELTNNPGSRILIFASYRDTVAHITSILKDHGISVSSFVGQGSRGTEKGMNQKKQIETVQKFRDGEFQVLVSTSVGEEGLDIPATDAVIFYEPVPSEVRSIQRRGRTGRFATGRVFVMLTRGTIDEINYYVSQRKEAAMKAMDHTTIKKTLEVA